MIKFFIKSGEIYSKPIEYIITEFSKNRSLPINFVLDKSDAQVVVDHTDSNSIKINLDFYDKLINQHLYNHQNYFDDKPFIRFHDGSIDSLSTAFYLINSFQEYRENATSDHNYDKFGRFRYDKSIQSKLNCIEDNIVHKCFDLFCIEHPLLAPYTKNEKPSRVFLTHDIDKMHGSFAEDGMWAFKHKRFDIILKIIIKEILLQPEWKNIDRIVKLESEYDLKSCFFWIATRKVDENGIGNADYYVNRVKGLTKVAGINGLHKSCYSYSLDEELEKLPFKTIYNRYHYLKIDLPESWNSIENSKIQFDASLGFAERYGFRNSYGLPFKPFDLTHNKPYDFIEVPLNVMDTTLMGYMKIPLNNTSSSIIEFIEKNKANSILSILWHNNYFTKYKYGGYLEEYKKILLYLIESKIKSITPEEIIKEYYHG
jgi:hypothetical protein